MNFILWLKAAVLAFFACIAIYRLWRDEPDTFAAWFARDGSMLWVILTVAAAWWLGNPAAGYGDGSDY